jgi:hypothetical protein
LKSKISLFRSPDENGPEIDEKDLPRCRKCQSLLRPHIVWFGEQIWSDVSEKIEKEIQLCDLFLVVCFLFFSFLLEYLLIIQRLEHHLLFILQLVMHQFLLREIFLLLR